MMLYFQGALPVISGVRLLSKNDLANGIVLL